MMNFSRIRVVMFDVIVRKIFIFGGCFFIYVDMVWIGDLVVFMFDS